MKKISTTHYLEIFSTSHKCLCTCEEKVQRFKQQFFYDKTTAQSYHAPFQNKKRL